MADSVYQRILRLSKAKKNKIAVGVLHDYPVSVAALKKVKRYMDITVVGPKEIKGFTYVHSTNANDLVRLATQKKVDAVFRGNFDAVEVYDALHAELKFTHSVEMVAPVVLRGVRSIKERMDKMVTVLPVSPSNDGVLYNKIKNIDANIAFWESFGVKPVIGILSAGKPTDIMEGIGAIDKTLTEAEFLVNWYTKKGYVAKHFNHQVEYASLESDILVYPNGITGNQGFRAMIFFGRNIALCGVATNLPIVYGQTAEAFRDWTDVLMFLNGYINRNLKLKK